MNQNKLSFESENLQVDYLIFNIQGTPDFDLVNRIAKYLFQHFDFINTPIQYYLKPIYFHSRSLKMSLRAYLIVYYLDSLKYLWLGM